MSDTNKSSKLGFGIVLGAVVGAVAGMLLAPKTGKELRKDAMKLTTELKAKALEYQKQLEGKDSKEAAKFIFGDVSENSVKLFQKVQKDLSVELAILSQNAKKIDKKKYGEAVKNVIDNWKADKTIPEESLKNMKTYLVKDFKKLTAKTVTKSGEKSTEKSAESKS